MRGVRQRAGEQRGAKSASHWVNLLTLFNRRFTIEIIGRGPAFQTCAHSAVVCRAFEKEMNDEEIGKLFDPLFADLRGDDCFPTKRLLLTHYTSIVGLEAILRTNEVWLSNPLFMNDMEEVRFGIHTGARLFLGSSELESACQTKERFDLLKYWFNYYFNRFDSEHVLDTYVFCLSEHAEDDTDGRLSMWRGYGGNGNGAAIVFDTAKIAAREESPLIIAHVNYGTAQERENWLQRRIAEFAEILTKSDIPNDKLYIAAHYFFERLKLFAIFTKHRGFLEENEWRIVYMRDRDPAKVFDKMFSYWVGPRGVEPKLKLKIEAIPGLPETNLSLSDIVKALPITL
jgi:DUF2971 family protein